MKTMIGTFKLINFPDRPFVFIRHIGPYMGDPALFERLFQKVSNWARNKNLLTSKSEAITIYHDDPEAVPADKQRFSVGFTIEKPVVGEGVIHLMKIPKGRYLVGSFEIDMDEYPDAWQSVMDYMGEHQLKPLNGIMYESYKNDPRQHPEGKHIVDICLSVA